MSNLRKSIIKYAMEGKLAEQNPNDESVSIFIEKIKQEKQRQIAGGKIKKDSFNTATSEERNNDYVPANCKNWEKIKLGDAVFAQTGAVFAKNEANKPNSNIRVLRGGNIINNKMILKDNDIYVSNSLISQKILLRRNDLITPSVSSIETIGKIAIVPSDYDNITVGGFVFILRPYLNDYYFSKFLYYYFQNPKFIEKLQSITKKSGSALYNLSKEKLLNLEICLPPYPEQKRIVMQLENLDSLICEYEKLIDTNDKLDGDLPEKLSKSIFKYALEGKLVKQDQNDKPASVLLEKIVSEKEKESKKGKSKQNKNEPFIYRDNVGKYYEKNGGKIIDVTDKIPYELPPGWQWVCASQLCLDIFNGKTPKYSSKQNKNVIIGQAANTEHGIDLSLVKYGDEEFVTTMEEKYFTKRGDVILNSLGHGTLGRCGIISTDDRMLTDGHPIVFRTLNYDISLYLLTYLHLNRRMIEESAVGTTNQIFLKIDIVSEYLIPLPPEEELYRINRKIDELLNKIGLIEHIN